MLNRDIFEEQELEYALSLIEDMERESNEMGPGVSDRKENQDVSIQEEEDEEAEQNPSPRTLREIRRAYFERLENRRRTASEPVPIRPVETERESDGAKPAGQTEPPRRRLRSGRSY